MRSYSSKEVIRILEEDGRYLVSCTGSHHQFKHPQKPGRVTVPHPKKDIPRGTLVNISKQSGVVFP